MNALVMVFIGGGLGSICRYGCAKYFTGNAANTFPTGTFIANILACLLLGYLFTMLSRGEWENSWRLLLLTGFCGGFSTFSTFAFENYDLFINGQAEMALTYMGLSILIGLLCIYVGLKIGNAF